LLDTLIDTLVLTVFFDHTQSLMLNELCLYLGDCYSVYLYNLLQLCMSCTTLFRLYKIFLDLCSVEFNLLVEPLMLRDICFSFDTLQLLVDLSTDQFFK